MKKHLRHLLGFVIAAVILQGLALLFVTPAGLELMYPLPVRIAAEKFKPETNTYAVYYDTRKEISEADLVVIGADLNVAETYDVLGHFTRFLKQYNNISAVMLDITEGQRIIWSQLMTEAEEERVSLMIEKLNSRTRLPMDCCDYAAELYFVNATMSPIKKFDVLSYSAKLPNVELPETLAEQVAVCFAGTERSALCVVDSRELEPGSSFREELEQRIDGKVFFLQMHYTDNCVSPETHRSYPFPLAPGGPAVYFVKNSKMDFFHRYYAFVNDLFGSDRGIEDRLDTRATPYYFIISGGTAAE